MNIAYPYRRNIHKKVDCRLGGFVRRLAPARVRGRLFIYRHVITGNYVLAMKDTKPNHIRDIYNIGPCLGRFTDMDALGVRAMFEVKRGSMKEDIIQSSIDYAKRRQQQSDEQKEHARWIGNKIIKPKTIVAIGV